MKYGLWSHTISITTEASLKALKCAITTCDNSVYATWRVTSKLNSPGSHIHFQYSSVIHAYLSINLMDLFFLKNSTSRLIRTSCSHTTVHCLLVSLQSMFSCHKARQRGRVKAVNSLQLNLSNQIKFMCIAQNHNLYIISFGFNKLCSCDILCP